MVSWNRLLVSAGATITLLTWSAVRPARFGVFGPTVPDTGRFGTPARKLTSVRPMYWLIGCDGLFAVLAFASAAYSALSARIARLKFALPLAGLLSERPV